MLSSSDLMMLQNHYHRCRSAPDHNDAFNNSLKMENEICIGF